MRTLNNIIVQCLQVDELRVQLDGCAADGEKNSSAKRRQEEKNRDELRRMERDRKEAQEVCYIIS